MISGKVKVFAVLSVLAAAALLAIDTHIWNDGFKDMPNVSKRPVAEQMFRFAFYWGFNDNWQRARYGEIK
jgi:hypothetical protein